MVQLDKHAIIGSHGVAKTDTVHALMQYLHRYSRAAIIPEVARLLDERGMPINRRTTYDAQLSIQSSQRTEELVFEQQIHAKKIKHIICDRSVIDNYVYALNKFPKRAHKEMYPDMLEWLVSHPYKNIFLVPLWNAELEIVPDGTRDTKKQFQIDIYNKLLYVLGLVKNELGIDVIKIPAKFYLQGHIEQSASFARYFETIYGYEASKKPQRTIISS